VNKLIGDFPGLEIDLVVCGDSHGQNAKVSNLQNMMRRVKYEHVVIVDSDIRVAPDYLEGVVGTLCQPGVGLVTCLYRAAGAPDFGARLEALGFTSEFAPGVLVAWMIEGVRFALGSTMATTRARLEEIGGLAVLSDYLADDFMLGNLIAGLGYEVRISRNIVEIAVAPIGFSGMVRHQLRWARSTRISRPLGYLGLILTQGTALAALYALVDRASTGSLALLAGTVAVRLTMAWAIGVHWLKDRLLRDSLWAVPIRDLLSFLIWAASWFGRRVEWRGRRFEVARDGKMVLAE
jgi:ceramide glucosyltransferase